jgi:hypothetical protein
MGGGSLRRERGGGERRECQLDVRRLSCHLSLRTSSLRPPSVSSGTAEADDYRELVENVVLPLFPTPSSYPANATAVPPPTIELLLCGYSFGALAASSCPPPPSSNTLRIRTSYLLISYPLSVTWALTFLQSGPFTKALRDLVHRGENRVLAIFGDQDQFSAATKLRAWAKGLEEVEGTEGCWSTVEVSGADHFWRDRRRKGALLEEVGRWLLSDDEEETAAPP